MHTQFSHIKGSSTEKFKPGQNLGYVPQLKDNVKTIILNYNPASEAEEYYIPIMLAHTVMIFAIQLYTCRKFTIDIYVKRSNI